MKKTFLLFLFCCITAVTFGQEKYTISGYIQDEATGEKLISANAYERRSASGTVSNTYGFFSLTLPKDSVEITFSYIGYQPFTQKFYLDKNIDLDIKLSSAVDLVTVEVTAENHYEKIEESTQMSQIEVPVEQIKKLPALLGEVDIMKTIQLLPGVQSGGEGQSGLYVRGGSPDQNLVLIDGVPIYNVSHVLGIFSVFNADAVKNVTLTKGGFPARYGGRLSSVLEINMKEGNTQKFHGEGSLGLISSKLTLEGPIVKDKTSFLVSGRRTYADLIFRPIIKANTLPGEELDLTLYFYDLNAKLQHKFNNKHRLFLSVYNGSDHFANEYTDTDNNGVETFGGGIKWGNLISAARWNWQVNPQLFANTTLTYSNYDVNIFTEQSSTYDGETESLSAKYISGIEDIAAKIDFDYIPDPKHYIRFGANATRHKYSPGALTIKAEIDESSLDTLIGSQNEYSMEYQLYIEDDINLGALKANVGLHSSLFNVNGKNYASLQPRLGLRYLLNNNWAVKGSYSRMAQYINLLSLEGFSLPSDLWVPSTDKTLPQRAWQVAAGAARTFGDGYEISVEGFYKKMNNLISYKDGASFLFGLDSDWEDKITQGSGEAYGAEFFLQKKKGRTTGWIGYTLSWNNRHFDELNGGKPYPFRYDRRHDISVVVSHDFNDKISASAAWVYGTGNAITLNTIQYPTSIYPQGDGTFGFGNITETGGEKNAFRMSNYHRLDVSVEFKKIRPKWERRWIISVYNAYYHHNPYFMIIDSEGQYGPNGNYLGSKKVLKEISILPIIPSLSYAFKF